MSHKTTIISTDNIHFTLTKPMDCTLIHEFADYSIPIPIPFPSHLIQHFLSFRSLFNKRKHKFPSRFQTLNSTQQQSLIEISNFLGHSSMTTSMIHLLYTSIYGELIPKLLTDM